MFENTIGLIFKSYEIIIPILIMLYLSKLNIEQIINIFKKYYFYVTLILVIVSTYFIDESYGFNDLTKYIIFLYFIFLLKYILKLSYRRSITIFIIMLLIGMFSEMLTIFFTSLLFKMNITDFINSVKEIREYIDPIRLFIIFLTGFFQLMLIIPIRFFEFYFIKENEK